MSATLQQIVNEREWSNSYGTFVSIDLDFGEFQAELSTKPENLVDRLGMLETNIGVESEEWEFEDRGSFSNGNPKPKKVTNYPGKPAAKEYAGGKREWTPRYTDTREGFLEEQSRIDRRRSLELAQASGVGIVTELAEKFYRFLQEPFTSAAGVTPPGEEGAKVPASASGDSGRDGSPPQAQPDDGYRRSGYKPPARNVENQP